MPISWKTSASASVVMLKCELTPRAAGPKMQTS